MKYLVDANIWLEILLEQSQAASAEAFMAAVDPSELCISDFALHTIGVKLLNLHRIDHFRTFLDETLGRGIMLAILELAAPESLLNVPKEYRLDFDDAYQYVIAERDELALVSFDKDFDRTPRGRLTPRLALRRRQRDDATDRQEANPTKSDSNSAQ